MMKTSIILFVLLAASAAAAQFAPMVPQKYPPVGSFGGPMVPSAPYSMVPNNVSGGVPPPPANGLLLEDNVSFLLLEDGSSKLCLESGC